jgi:hypothetical protein
MGGFGSGRRSENLKVEACCVLDVNRLSRSGYLTLRRWSDQSWTRNDGKRQSVGILATAHGIELHYRVGIDGNDWRDIVQSVPVVRVPCRYGGTRPFFSCPGLLNGLLCKRRVVKLYLAGQHFRCRRCHRLTYQSQAEGLCDRALRRAEKLRVRLGGERWTPYSWPGRPTGMWRRTFMRLTEAAVDAEMIAKRAFMVECQRRICCSATLKLKSG